MPTPGNVQRVRAKQMEEAAARKALKAQRREENERNRLAKEARRGDSSVHERDSTRTPIRRRLMPVYLSESRARPHGVSRAPRQCSTGVAHRASEDSPVQGCRVAPPRRHDRGTTGTPARLRDVQRVLESDMTASPSLAELGRRAGASERTLSRLFGDELGMGYTAWRTQLRLHRAVLLLAEGRTGTQAAAVCGSPRPAPSSARSGPPSDALPGRCTDSQQAANDDHPAPEGHSGRGASMRKIRTSTAIRTRAPGCDSVRLRGFHHLIV